MNEMMTIDKIIRKEFAEDEPFIGHVGEQPRPTFWVAQDVFEGYMILIQLGDDKIHVKLVWVAMTLSDLVLQTTSEHF
jgi:hypothetical protein